MSDFHEQEKYFVPQGEWIIAGNVSSSTAKRACEVTRKNKLPDASKNTVCLFSAAKEERDPENSSYGEKCKVPNTCEACKKKRLRRN